MCFASVRAGIFLKNRAYLICMYLPVAMAAGEANLAIDEVKAEGDATAVFARRLVNCDQSTACKNRSNTYIAAATAAQPFASSCWAPRLTGIVDVQERCVWGASEKASRGTSGRLPAYPALMSSRPISGGQLLSSRQDVVPGRPSITCRVFSVVFFFFSFSLHGPHLHNLDCLYDNG